jgi:hypothetical protein
LAIEPKPNPDTIEALLETTWRLSDGERLRTASLDGKASSLAAFASIVLSITATLGTNFLQAFTAWWAFALYVVALAALVAAVGLAVWTLMPREHLSLGMAYIRRFPTWSQIRRAATDIRGETMSGLIEAMAREREVNAGKARLVRYAFLCLLGGLFLVAMQASILAGEVVFG